MLILETTMDNTSEYNITLKIRNNLLLRAFKAKGEVPGKVLADKIGITYGMLNKYIALKESPIDKADDYKESALRICDFLNMSPRDLWTDEQLTPLEKSTVELEISYEQISPYLPSTDDPTLNLECGDLKQTIDTILENLNPSNPDYRYVVERRFGLTGPPATFNELAEELGISHERVRQIEAKALRMMRHPSRSIHLVDYSDTRYNTEDIILHTEINRLEKEIFIKEWNYIRELDYANHCNDLQVDQQRFRKYKWENRAPVSADSLCNMKHEIDTLQVRLKSLKIKRNPWKEHHASIREQS